MGARIDILDYEDEDKTVPDNYRGITLLSVVGKVCAAVRNERIAEWSEIGKTRGGTGGFPVRWIDY